MKTNDTLSSFKSSAAQQNKSYLRPHGYLENEEGDNHIPEYEPSEPREVQLNEC